MKTATGALSVFRRLVIVIAIAIVFVFGLATTVILSLRSPIVKVPDVVGKDRFEAEHVLGDAGLNFRVRKARPNGQLKADTVVFQVPRAGEEVKGGQTVAMDISRPLKDGESSEALPENTPEEQPASSNANEASTNENRAKRNKNTNKNANENANANTGNRNSNTGNRNANANANRLPTNKNANANTNGTNPSSNRPALIINSNANHGSNQNGNVRQPAVKPTPVKPKPENP